MTAEAPRTPFRSDRGRSSQARQRATKLARPKSSEDKAALTAGRNESRAVRRYLEALHAHRRSGATAGPQTVRQRIEAIDAQLPEAEPAVKVRLIQERMDLYAQLKALGAASTLGELEQEFVGAAGAYSARKGISYAAWREVGVDDAVLMRAGIPRTP